MDRQQAKKLLPIIQAFAEGEMIQTINTYGEWADNYKPLFNCDPGMYRIKPKSRYRPFKDAEECWNEMEKHRHFGWIRCKDTSIPGKFMLINSLRNDEASIISGIDFTYSELLECYTFVDGAPFGVKEEE